MSNLKIYILTLCTIIFSLFNINVIADDAAILIGPGVTTLNDLDENIELVSDTISITPNAGNGQIAIDVIATNLSIKGNTPVEVEPNITTGDLEISLTEDYLHRVKSLNNLENDVKIQGLGAIKVERASPSSQNINISLKTNDIKRVTSLNNIENDVKLKAGAGIIISDPANNEITISADGGGGSVSDCVKKIGDTMSGELTNTASITIGSRTDDSLRGENSFAQGSNMEASGANTEALGVDAKAVDDYSYVWNGIFGLEEPYSSHDPGTYNINPTNGIEGFYIGDENLKTSITNLTIAIIMDMITNGFILDDIAYTIDIKPSDNNTILYYIKKNTPTEEKYIPYAIIRQEDVAATVPEGSGWKLSNVVVGASVQTIGENAFNGTALQDITFSVKVQTIEKGAFKSTKLINIELPDLVSNVNDEVFYNCASLTNITFTPTTTNIGASAFAGCKKLNYIEFPESLDRINTNAFYLCTGLSNLIFPDNLTIIRTGAFQDCTGLTNISFSIDSKLHTVGAGAFSNCDKITDIIFPTNLTLVASHAFRYNYSLTNVVFRTPLDVGNLQLNFSAFRTDTNLTTIDFGENLGYIGLSAFQNCESLKSISLPANTTSVIYSAFGFCPALTNIEVDPNNNKLFVTNGLLVKSNATTTVVNGNTIETNRLVINCSINTNNIVIPDGIHSIETHAFTERYNITNVVIPSSLTNIGYSLFSRCPNIKRFEIDPANPVFYSSNGFFIKRGTALSPDSGGEDDSEEEDDSGEDNIIIDSEPRDGEGEQQVDPEDILMYGVSATGELEIPPTVISIYSNSFDNRHIGLLKIGKNVENIELNAFYYCGSINFEVDESNPNYYSTNKMLLTKGEGASHINKMIIHGAPITNVYISDDVSAINSYSFYASRLTNVFIGANVTNISGSAFANNSGLTNVIFGNKLQRIAGSTFWNCSGLKELILPDSLATDHPSGPVGASAFHNCNGLTSISVPYTWVDERTAKSYLSGTEYPSSCTIIVRDGPYTPDPPAPDIFDQTTNQDSGGSEAPQNDPPDEP